MANSRANPSIAISNTRENVPEGIIQPVRMKTRVLASSRPVLGEIRNRNTRSSITTSKKVPVDVTKPSLETGKAAKEKTEVPADQVVEVATSPKVTRALPEGVPDVDLQDVGNPQLCSEYAKSIYSYLRQLEEGLVIKKDFLKGCPVNSRMRAVLVDWLVEVHTQFKLLQETLYMTVYILDRYLQAEGLTLKRNQLQLVGVTAMFVASKVEEMYAPELNDFVYITDSAYTVADIKACELRLLQTLAFNLSRPLPLHFLRRNSKAGDVDMQQHSLAKYLMEVSLPEYDMAHLPPSIVAAAALLLSLRLLQPETCLASLWTATLSHYSTYSVKQLLPVMHRIAVVVKKTADPKVAQKAVSEKYRTRRFLEVSKLQELKGEVIQRMSKKDFSGL